MSCKNTLLCCASAIALSLAMAQSALAEEMAADAAAAAETPPAEVVVVEEAVATAAESTAEAAPAEASAATVPPHPPMSMMPPPMEPPEIPPEVLERMEQHRKKMAMSPEERWETRRAKLNQRYEDLRARAADAGMNLPESAPWNREPEWLSYDEMRQQMQERGIDLPEQPAWPGGMGMSDEELQANREAMQEKIDEMRKEREKMAAMTAEERDAFREQRYQEMRGRAASHGIELSETPPWKQPPAIGLEPAPLPAMPEPPAGPAEADWGRYQEIIAGMSPEEREACMAMHRMHMQQRMQRPPQPMAPPRGYGRGYGQGPGQGYGQGYGPGYGYGPGGGHGPRWGGWQGYPE